MIKTLRVVAAEVAILGYKIINRTDYDPAVHTLHGSETDSAPDTAEVALNVQRRGSGSVDKYGATRAASEPNRDLVTGEILPDSGSRLAH